MPRTKKQNKRKNAFATQIASMLVECKSWAEFNIKMILNGYELNSDMLVYLIHFAFVENFGWNAWNMAAEEMQSKTAVVKHAQSILVGMCEDNDAVFTDDMVDTIVKKTIFNISTIKVFNFYNTNFSSNIFIQQKVGARMDTPRIDNALIFS